MKILIGFIAALLVALLFKNIYANWINFDFLGGWFSCVVFYSIAYKIKLKK